MKSKMIKKFVALSMSTMLLAGFCGGCGEQNPAGEENNSATARSIGDVAAGAGMESWVPFEENVTITIPVYDRGVDGLPAVDNNYWTKWVQTEFGDKWNITVDYEPIPRGDVMTKYALLIASKKTPTILMEYDYPKVTQWASEGAMTTFDMNDFAQVAPTYYQNMVDLGLLTYSTLKDETYYVLAERPAVGSWATFVRMDWLRQVGYDHIPTNRAEELDALTKIVKAGLTDIEPINHTLPSSNYQAANYREFPLDEEEWAIYADLNVCAFSYEPVKENIRYDNERWHAGIITKEFDLNNSSDLQANFIAGKIYAYGGYMSSKVDWLEAFYENNPGAELAMCNLIEYDANGEMIFDLTDGVPQGRSDNPYGMTIGFSSFATDEQLKAAWMYLEWMIQPEVLHVMQYGIEGINYKEYDADGYPIRLDVEGEERLNYNNNKDMWCVVVETVERRTPEDMIKAIVPQGIPQDFTEQMIAGYYRAQETGKRGWTYPDPQYSVTIDAQVEYAGALQSLFQEYYTALVKCDPEKFDELYEEYKQKYLKAGYQEIIDEKREAYRNGYTSKLPDAAKK